MCKKIIAFVLAINGYYATPCDIVDYHWNFFIINIIRAKVNIIGQITKLKRSFKNIVGYLNACFKRNMAIGMKTPATRGVSWCDLNI